MSDDNDSKQGGVGASFPLTEEIKLGETGLKTINDLNKKAALAAMKIFKRALSTASEPLFRRGLGERYFTHGSRDGALMIWTLATIASGCAAAFGFGTTAGWLLWYIHWFALANFFNHWWFPVFSGLVFMVYYSILCVRDAKFVSQFRNQGIPYHSMSRGEMRWNEKAIFVPAAILAALLLFNTFIFIALVFAIVMGKKIADEQEAVIYSRYLDAIDEKLENQYMKLALLGQAKAEQSYLSRPLSEKKFKPEIREQIADAWTRGSVTVIEKPRRSGQPTLPENNPPQPPDAAAVSAQPLSVATPAGSAAPAPVEPAKISRPATPVSKAELNLPLFNLASSAATVPEKAPLRTEPAPMIYSSDYFDLREKLEKAKHLPDAWTKRFFEIFQVYLQATNEPDKLRTDPKAMAYLQDFLNPLKSLVEAAMNIDAKAARAKSTNSKMDEESSQRALGFEGELIQLQNAMKARIDDLRKLGVSMD